MKKTSNAQRRTPNIELRSVREDEGPYGSKRKTLNARPIKGNPVVILKMKTPNAHRLNIERTADGLRVTELPDSSYDASRNPRQYDLEDRLLEFAVNIVELTESLPSTRSGNHIAGQLLRCGTSPLSNHGEVEAAESRKDFLHKLRICLKELREAKRWLRLVGRLKRLGQPANLTVSLNEIEELIRIFAASVKTAERNAK